jgi:hypothetical protein
LIEGLVFPSSHASIVQDIGDLLIAMVVEETIDFRNDLGIEAADVSDRPWTRQLQAAGRAAREPHIRGDRRLALK